MAAVKKSESAKRVADVIEAEATASEKYVTFTVEIGDAELELTTVREVTDLPRYVMKFVGKKDLESVSMFLEALLGPEQLGKVDALQATIGEFSEIAATWADVSGLEGK